MRFIIMSLFNHIKHFRKRPGTKTIRLPGDKKEFELILHGIGPSWVHITINFFFVAELAETKFIKRDLVAKNINTMEQYFFKKTGKQLMNVPFLVSVYTQNNYRIVKMFKRPESKEDFMVRIILSERTHISEMFNKFSHLFLQKWDNEFL